MLKQGKRPPIARRTAYRVKHSDSNTKYTRNLTRQRRNWKPSCITLCGDFGPIVVPTIPAATSAARLRSSTVRRLGVVQSDFAAICRSISKPPAQVIHALQASFRIGTPVEATRWQHLVNRDCLAVPMTREMNSAVSALNYNREVFSFLSSLQNVPRLSPASFNEGITSSVRGR